MEYNLAKEKMLLEELGNMWAELKYGARVYFSHDFNKYSSNSRYYIGMLESKDTSDVAKKVYYRRLKEDLGILKKHIEDSSSKIVIQWHSYRFSFRRVEVVEEGEDYIIFRDLSWNKSGIKEERKFLKSEIKYGEEA